MSVGAASSQSNYPVDVVPNPGAGKFHPKRDPDKPLLAFYGGVGLHKLPDGRWSGYAQTSPKDVEYLIQRCKENGMSRIYASFSEEEYPSHITPSPPEGSPDYIALCIKLAHENGIEVYADISTFGYFASKDGAFLKAHPDYLTRNRAGELDPHQTTFSAAWPLVRQYKQAIIMEWVHNYPIDGIQLDHIRYPFYTHNLLGGFCQFGYDAPSLEKFRKHFGYDDSYTPAPNDPRWIKVRADTVTQFLRELQADLKRSGVKLPVGVYNSGTYGRRDSYHDVLQDWQQWEDEGLVNQHSPMFLMTAGMTTLTHAVQSIMDIKRPDSEVLGPIFLAEGFDTAHGDVPTPDMVRDAARRLIKMGCNSLWFCRASEIEEYHLWPVVKEISQWSISEIRKEKLDPFFENYLSDGPLHTDAEMKLSPDQTTRASQTASFRPISYMAVNSLLCRMDLDLSQAHFEGTPLLQMKLHYKNGVTESLTYAPDAQAAKEARMQWVVPVKTDFADLALDHATLTLQVPKGSGVVKIKKAELLRDPLLHSAR
jgi:hypothetical protein